MVGAQLELWDDSSWEISVILFFVELQDAEGAGNWSFSPMSWEDTYGTAHQQGLKEPLLCGHPCWLWPLRHPHHCPEGRLSENHPAIVPEFLPN